MRRFVFTLICLYLIVFISHVLFIKAVRADTHHIGRARRSYNEAIEATYIDIVDHTGKSWLCFDPIRPYNFIIIKPDGTDPTRIREGAVMDYVIINGCHSNEIRLLESFDNEYDALANEGHELDATLTKRQLSLLNGLSHHYYSVRKTCFEKIVTSRDFRIIRRAMISKDCEVKARSNELFDAVLEIKAENVIMSKLIGF